MARLSPVLALAALCLTHMVQAARMKMDANNTRQKDDASAGCTDFCVQCQDGSSVWYGRGKNWWKAGATITLGGLTVLTGGVVQLAAAGGVGVVAGIGADKKTINETHTSWTGYLPTTGLACERVDVLKYDKTNECKADALMEASDKTLGRVKNNYLKPYGADGKLLQGSKGELSYTEADMTSYKEGCKVVKGAGASGAFNQLWSNFQKKCADKVSKGINTCSGHSKLCGAGKVAGITDAKTADECYQQCQLKKARQIECKAQE